MGLDYCAREIAGVSPRESPITLFIVSDVRFLRESLAEVLPRAGPLRILGAFGGIQEVVSHLSNNQPDILLLDGAFPGGHSAAKQFRALAPKVRVVVTAVVETADDVIAWGEVGVAGYIPRTAGLDEIVPLLMDIERGKQPCSASVAGAMLRRLFNGVHPFAPPMAKLTAREAQIASMIAAGLSNKDIARRLDIGLATAKTHVHHLLGKLNVQRRGEAANWMREQSGRQ
jgi:DNA-binding NarL/FixJ family response regulator